MLHGAGTAGRHVTSGTAAAAQRGAHAVAVGDTAADQRTVAVVLHHMFAGRRSDDWRTAEIYRGRHTPRNQAYTVLRLEAFLFNSNINYFTLFPLDATLCSV